MLQLQRKLFYSKQKTKQTIQYNLFFIIVQEIHHHHPQLERLIWLPN